MDTYSIYGLDFDSVVGGDIVYINELSRKEKSDWEDKLIICEPNLFFCTSWCVLSQSVYLKGIRTFRNKNHIYQESLGRNHDFYRCFHWKAEGIGNWNYGGIALAVSGIGNDESNDKNVIITGKNRDNYV